MADSALFIGWDRPVRGRESHAIEMFQAFQAHLDQEKKKGLVDSYEPCLLSAHGGNLNGFILVRCSEKNLPKITSDDKFRKLVSQCIYNVDGFGVVEGYLGRAIERQMKNYASNF